MTSRNLCFKLMREDLKRRVWTIALLVLSFFFCVVVPVIFISGESRADYSTEAQWMWSMSRDMLSVLGEENPFVIMILVIASLVCAISGFSYLHSAKKVDLYHSLPVKRGTLFLAHYFDGILMTAVIYLAALVIGMVIGAAAGVGFDVTCASAMRGYVFHMSYFCLLYTTMTLAVMMTGNIIISLLGDAVFCFYGPAVVALVMGYIEMWFETYSYKSPVLGDGFFRNLIKNTSPFVNYFVQIDRIDSMNLPLVAAVVILITAVLAVVCWWLYGKRPSEAAGKAMAFRLTMTPIKILLVIPSALVFGLFFWAMRNTMVWAVFGILCGAVIVHCLIEIIYHFDFRKLFCHKIHMVACIAASLVFLCGFKYDWFGYDSYMPKGDQVQSASLALRNLDNWVTYGNVEEYEGSDGIKYYRWGYQDSLDYVQEHMQMTDLADVLSIARVGIQLNQEMQGKNWDYDREIDRYTIQYKMNNGKMVVREYRIYRDLIQEEIQRISESQEYKMGTYPLLSQTAEKTTRANFQQFNLIQSVEMETGSPELAELLKTYQEEFKNLTTETRKQEIPIATIQFVTQDMDEALYQYRLSLNDNEYRSRVFNIEDRCYYPVYPSFTRTIGLLEESGIKVAMGIPAEDISQIYLVADPVIYESSYKREVNEQVITDRGQIEKIAPALIFQDYYYMNQMSTMDLEPYVYATVYIKSDSQEKAVECFVDKSKLPDFLR